MRGTSLHICCVLLPSRTESGLLVDQAELERLAVLIHVLVKGVTASTAAVDVDAGYVITRGYVGFWVFEALLKASWVWVFVGMGTQKKTNASQ